MGAGGCEDCHSTESAFFFGDVTVDSPIASAGASTLEMIEFQNMDSTYIRYFNRSFVFRPMLKIISIAACVILSAVLLLYSFNGLSQILKSIAGFKAQTTTFDTPEGLPRFTILKNLIYVVGVVSFLLLAVTGFDAFFVTGSPITGYMLMLHCTVAPVFIVCLTVIVLLWAHHNRFSRTTQPGRAYIITCRKICFWLILLLALPVILSTALSMFPLFGTDGQKFLYHVHQYCTLIFAAVVVIFILLLWITQPAPHVK